MCFRGRIRRADSEVYLGAYQSLPIARGCVMSQQVLCTIFLQSSISKGSISHGHTCFLCCTESPSLFLLLSLLGDATAPLGTVSSPKLTVTELLFAFSNPVRTTLPPPVLHDSRPAISRQYRRNYRCQIALTEVARQLWARWSSDCPHVLSL